MTRRDWELLGKQIRPPQPAPPQNGIIVAMLVGIFLLGVTTGGLLFAPGSTPVQTAGDGGAALAFFLNGPRHETP
jgi:hypothetical protein